MTSWPVHLNSVRWIAPAFQPARVRFAGQTLLSWLGRRAMRIPRSEPIQLILVLKNHFCKEIASFSGCELGLRLEMAYIASGNLRSFEIDDDPAKRVFIPRRIRRVDLLHRLFSSRAILLACCGVRMNLPRGFVVKTSQFAEHRNAWHFIRLTEGPRARLLIPRMGPWAMALVFGTAKLVCRQICQSNLPLLEFRIERPQSEQIKFLKLCEFHLLSRELLFPVRMVRLQPRQFCSLRNQLFIFRR